MDTGDEAAAIEERYRQQALSNSRKVEGPPFTGQCYYCDTPTETPRRWCDADCRDEYQKLSHR